MQTFLAQAQPGSSDPLSVFTGQYNFFREGVASTDGLHDKLVLNYPGWVGFESSQWDMLFGEENADQLNPHVRGGYGTYQLKCTGFPSTQGEFGPNEGVRGECGIYEFKDNGATITGLGTGYTNPAYSYGTLRSDDGPREGVIFAAGLNGADFGDGPIIRVFLWARGWSYDTDFNSTTEWPAFGQYSTGSYSLPAPWAKDVLFDEDDNLIQVAWELKAEVTADDIVLSLVDQDGNATDLRTLLELESGDLAGLAQVLTRYRQPGAAPLGYLRKYPHTALQEGRATMPTMEIIQAAPVVPDPIPCCPPLPQREEGDCGDTSCGRAFKKVDVSWSDTVKLDGEYVFPESRLYPVETVRTTVPIGRESRGYRLTLGSVLWSPLTVAGLEWTGQYFNNTRRTG